MIEESLNERPNEASTTPPRRSLRQRRTAHIGHAYTTTSTSLPAFIAARRRHLLPDRHRRARREDPKVAEAPGKTPASLHRPGFRQSSGTFWTSPTTSLSAPPKNGTKRSSARFSSRLRQGRHHLRRIRRLYCVGCERYHRKRAGDGKCPQHDIVLEYRQRENYFSAWRSTARGCANL